MFEADSGILLSDRDHLGTISGPTSPSHRWAIVPRSLIPSASNFNSLIESGRSLTSHVQSLIGDHRDQGQVRLWPESDAQPAENGQLLKNVSVAFERQEAINKANAQLTKLNYLANVANCIKHKQVEKAVAAGQMQLTRMQTKILEQSGTIDVLNESVTNLEVDVQCTQDTCSRLDRSLRSQQELLNTSIRENREAIEQQNSILVKQQNMVKNLLRQRIRHDFMVDAGLVATAVYLCNGILVDYPLQMVLMVVPNYRLRKWMRQFSKVALIFKVVSILKSVSIKCGIHNSVGSMVPYLQEAWGISTGQLLSVFRVIRNTSGEPEQVIRNTSGEPEHAELKHSSNALDLC